MKDTTSYILVMVLGLAMLIFVLLQAHEEEDQMNFKTVLVIEQYNDTYYRITTGKNKFDSLTEKGMVHFLIGYSNQSEEILTVLGDSSAEYYK